MKRLTLALLVLLLSTLIGCGAAQNADSTWDRKTEYSSDTSAEDCYLCGGAIENLIPSHWGQKNVAFISLNTFEIIPLEINRYDEIDGHLIEEYAEATSFQGGGTDGGFSAKFVLTYDRGFALGALDFNNDETLDIDKAASFLCTDCLNDIIKSTHEHGQYLGVGVINLETKEICLLERLVNGFGIGDYYILCKLLEQKKHDPLRMQLLVFLSPVRYERPPGSFMRYNNSESFLSP